MTTDDIGVVVIGRNEGERLVGCLASIPSNVKSVIYVDSGSTDGSVATAERLGAVVVALSADRPFTAARGRNEGFAALRRLRPDIQLVQFVDGDCQLDGDWFSTAADFIRQRDDIAVVCGRRRERHPSTSLYNRLCDMEWNTRVGQTTACGGDLLVRAEAFAAVGGFRGGLIAGEEPELCLRLRERGWKIWRLDAEMTRHDAAMKRFDQWWIRAVRGGYGMAEVSRLHWRSPFAIWKREFLRAVLLGGAFPALICILALIHPIALAALLIYVAQVCRIAIIRRPASADSWAYAVFATLARFAEFEGALKYYWRRLYRRPIALIEYK